jgi:hypothetical protein
MIQVKRRRWLFEILAVSTVLAITIFSEPSFSVRPQSADPASPVPRLGSDPQSSLPSLQIPSRPRLTHKQRQALLTMNYKKMRKQAAALASLANSLQKDVDQSNANVLSVAVIKKAKQIEKLAKRIQGTARGY